jgi:sec-independent protein translocase protein TatB
VFGIGLPELAVIVVVAVIVFGPDRLPEFARQAGRFIRQVRTFATSARDDIRAELGPDFADFELTDLDPRRAVRKYVSDVWDESADDDGEEPSRRPGQRPLETGELPPYDSDAT